MNPELLVAVSAVVVSVASVATTIYFGWCTRDHNKRSVRPLPYVLPSDFEDQISVRLWNNGSGPLILKQVIARHKKDKSSGHLIDLVPSPPEGLLFDNFVKVSSGRAVLPSKSLDLLDFGVDENDPKAVRYRNELRDFLGNTVVQVEYTDIYELAFPAYIKDLKWLHRHSS